MSFDRRLRELGIVLPAPWQLPSGVVTSASFVRQQGKRLLISGHVPLDSNGSVCGPFGKVGQEVSLDAATLAAKQCMLAILSSVVRFCGSLDAIDSWTVVRGYVSGTPDFDRFPAVMNGASDLLRDVFGDAAGAHARLAIGVVALPFSAAVEIEAELQLQ